MEGTAGTTGRDLVPRVERQRPFILEHSILDLLLSPKVLPCPSHCAVFASFRSASISPSRSSSRYSLSGSVSTLHTAPSIFSTEYKLTLFYGT